MICRVCKTELVKGEEKCFETLCDHVSDPNGVYRPMRPTFECPNKDCIVNTVAVGFWDDYGDFYSENYVYGEEAFKPYVGYSGHLPALDSHAASADTTIYKKNENFTFFHTITRKYRIKVKYEADNFGKVTKRKFELDIWRRDFNNIKHMIEFITHFGKTEDWCNWIGSGGNFRMYKYSWKKYCEAVADLDCSEANDGQEEIDRYRKRLDRVIEDSKKYHVNRWRNTWRDSIHGEWQWWRPLVHKRIMKHYNKHFG